MFLTNLAIGTIPYVDPFEPGSRIIPLDPYERDLTYEDMKEEIEKMGLPPREYQIAIRAIADYLGL